MEMMKLAKPVKMSLEEMFGDTVAHGAYEGDKDLTECVPNFLEGISQVAKFSKEECFNYLGSADEAILYMYNMLDVFMEDESRDKWSRLGIENPLLQEVIELSYKADEYNKQKFPSSVFNGIYGNFDATVDENGKVWFYEYNGNTPVMLYESTFINDQFIQKAGFNVSEQSNFTSELISDHFRDLKGKVGELNVAVAGASGHVNDLLTQETIAHAISQAGHEVTLADIAEDLRFDHFSKMFYFGDVDMKPLDMLFSMYPWEEYDNEALNAFKLNYQNIIENGRGTVISEPAFKVVMSNKLFFAYCWENDPEGAREAGLMETYFEAPTDIKYVKKPVYGRMSANIEVFDKGELVSSTDGVYNGELTAYQRFHNLVSIGEGHYQIRVWLANTSYGMESSGLAVRKSNSPNHMSVETEEVIPHVVI